MLLWVNRPSLFIGRFQNPWAETHISQVLKDQLPLIRRISGGGAVYHDEGNLNVSVMGPGQNFDKQIRMEPLITFLKHKGHNVLISDRGDGLLFESQQVFKFSGSAFKHRKNSSLHHFTVLLNANLVHLWQYLRGTHPEAIESKSIQSRRHQVRNLGHHQVSEFIQEWGDFLGKRIESTHDFGVEPALMDKFKSHQWLFGETPDFQFYSADRQHFLTAKKGHFITEDQQNLDRLWKCEHAELMAQSEKKILGVYNFSLFKTI